MWKIPCTVDHGKNVNLIGLHAIDNAVRPFNDLANLFRLELGDLPSGKRKIRYLPGPLRDSVNHSPRILD
jgi:hypothetical protein